VTRYRLIEVHADGWREEETFNAPDDEAAWRRVLEATDGDVLELWRCEQLVRTKPPRLEVCRDRPGDVQPKVGVRSDVRDD